MRVINMTYLNIIKMVASPAPAVWLQKLRLEIRDLQNYDVHIPPPTA